jgi:hypothetical protein
MAQGLGIAFHVVSVFGWGSMVDEVKGVLKIPEFMNIAYFVRLGCLVSEPPKYLRACRDREDFTCHNRFKEKGF